MNARACPKRGFTLLELIAAMAIGVLLLSLCSLTTGGAVRHCRETHDVIGVERGARRVIQQLVEDLSLAVRQAGVLHEQAAEGRPGDRFGVHCLMPASQQTEEGAIGDLCAVIYQCQEVRVDGRSVMCLMRTVCDSDDVYQAVQGGRSGEVWRQRSKLDELMAHGVVSFRLKRMVRSGTSGWREWRKEDGDRIHGFEVALVMSESADGSVRDERGEPLEEQQALDGFGAGIQEDMRVYRALVVLGRDELE